MGGLAAGFAAGTVSALEFSPVFGSVAAAIFGLAIGLVTMLLASQAQLLKLTELVLAFQRKGRIRFILLLEEALSLQVLRQAGPVYQFRHAAMQDRLAKT